MEKLKGQSKFKHGRMVKTGILLCNLGTPTNPDKKNVKKYLRQFLSDRRVVELPKISLVADSQRHYPKYSAKKIRTHTRKYGQKKALPLLFYSDNLTKALNHHLERETPWVTVRLGMRYGLPQY